VEYHVRSARLTDVDAAIRILMRDPASTDERRDDADRLRNLLFVPAATVVVAAAGRAESVARAAVATERSAIGASIVEHLVVSARNKGCTRVDVTDPLASAEPAPLKRAGFARRGALLSRAIG